MDRKVESKPDEGRLEEFFGLHHAELDGIMMSVLKQIASIKDAECQEKVERIFDEIRGRLRNLLEVVYGEKAQGVRDSIKILQALKKKELEDALQNKTTE